MANVYRLRVGERVSYLSPFVDSQDDIRWRVAKITSITDVNNVVLAIVEDNGVQVALNAGVAVPRRTAATQTNVWRPN